MKEDQNKFKPISLLELFDKKSSFRSKTYSNPKNITYFDSQQECKPIKKINNEENHANFELQSPKLELINEILRVLGLNQSIQTLQAEANRRYQCRNPQSSSGMKKNTRDNNLSLEVKIENIISKNLSFEEMLQSLSTVLNQQTEQPIIEQILEKTQQTDPFNNPKLEKAIQSLFPKKETITVPIFKELQIQCAGKHILFADIEDEGGICLLDNSNFLAVISTENGRRQMTRINLVQKRSIIDMKWANSQVIVLLTSNNKVLFYNSRNLTQLKIVKSHRLAIAIHQICILKTKQTNETKNMYILSASQTRFAPIKFNFEDKSITEETVPHFQQSYALKAITAIKVPHKVTFHRVINNEDQQSQFNIVTDIEHFYGLAKNAKKIIKFDTVVEKSGVIWQCRGNQTVFELKNSSCGYFLQVLMVREQKKPSHQYPNENKISSFMKISGNGCVLQKTDFRLSNLLNSFQFGLEQIKPFYQSKGLKWHKLSPEWVRCYSHKNNFFYFSIKSGRIIFSQEVQQERVRILCIGSQNSILYQSKGRLVLLTTSQKTQTKIVLQNRTNLDMRQSLIQRFSRLHGIPQNLLLLLRSIRNNDIQLMEIPE